MWYQTIAQTFKIKDLRNKILFVLGMFVIYRLMCNTPIPGIDSASLKNFFNNFQIFQLLGAFTGGSMDRLSVAMLGLGPYITAIIILQLLTMIFPSLERLYKEEGEAGRMKFNQYARIATVPLALLQGYAMLVLFQRQGVIGFDSPLQMIASLLTITAGSMLLMWMGELITEKGIGNGVSLLIFAGIIADFPKNIQQMVSSYTDASQIPGYAAFFLMSIVMIAAVVLINEARRNIPVTYAKRVRGMKTVGGASTYLPLNINPAGVIPIIFALSILLFPSMIGSFLQGQPGWVGAAAAATVKLFDSSGAFYLVTYFILVVLFTYFTPR